MGGQDSRATEAIGWALVLNLVAGPLLIGSPIIHHIFRTMKFQKIKGVKLFSSIIQ